MIPDNIYPARGRKHTWQLSINCLKVFNSRQYLPRKGTETHVQACQLDLFWQNSRQYLPRKGTETNLMRSLQENRNLFPTIFTPQGDGNTNK